MQDEVNEKVVSLAIKTSKLTAEVLQKAMKALLAKGKGQLTKAPHGKITMRQLMKQGEKVSNIEITDQNIKAFDPIARKNGLDYNVKKIENGKPPTYRHRNFACRVLDCCRAFYGCEWGNAAYCRFTWNYRNNSIYSRTCKNFEYMGSFYKTQSHKRTLCIYFTAVA